MKLQLFLEIFFSLLLLSGVDCGSLMESSNNMLCYVGLQKNKK